MSVVTGRRFQSPILLIAAAVVLFSTGGLLIKKATLSAYEISFGRSLIAAVTVILVTGRAGFRLTRLTALAAIFYAATLLLFVMATKLTTAANAIFLQYTAPVYMLILEPLIFKEKFHRRDILVVGGCLAGMTLFFVGQLRPQDVAGNITALASGLAFALFSLTLRRSLAAGGHAVASVVYGNLLLAAVTAPIFFRGIENLTTTNVLILLALGVFQIGLAYLLFTAGMERGVRSLDAGIVGYIEPALNPVWVFLFIGERPSQYALIGGAMIIAAVMTHTILSAGNRRRAEPVVGPD
ncbi:MAG TPA: EamA family transporter [Pyrinomonadaceae bacterium]|jgi:drug/metabolite transporter (DMT)-like permease|nr:EamA family transporter [Pyrinomonadaceae bacterium]